MMTTVFPSSEKKKFVCYQAYHPTNEECQAQSTFVRKSLSRSDSVLALLYEVWLTCITNMRHTPYQGNDTVVSNVVREFLDGRGTLNDIDRVAFHRFTRLFLDAHDRGDDLAPYYSIMDAYWRGADIVPAEGGPSRRITVLPQPTHSALPQLEWVFNRPLLKHAVVCTAWDIHLADAEGIEAGRLGRVERSGSKSCDVRFQDHPYGILCLSEMLMLPKGALSRGMRPPKGK